MGDRRTLDGTFRWWRKSSLCLIVCVEGLRCWMHLKKNPFYTKNSVDWQTTSRISAQSLWPLLGWRSIVQITHQRAWATAKLFWGTGVTRPVQFGLSPDIKQDGSHQIIICRVTLALCQVSFDDQRTSQLDVRKSPKGYLTCGRDILSDSGFVSRPEGTTAETRKTTTLSVSCWIIYGEIRRILVPKAFLLLIDAVIGWSDCVIRQRLAHSLVSTEIKKQAWILKEFASVLWLIN